MSQLHALSLAHARPSHAAAALVVPASRVKSTWLHLRRPFPMTTLSPVLPPRLRSVPAVRSCSNALAFLDLKGGKGYFKLLSLMGCFNLSIVVVTFVTDFQLQVLLVC